MSVSLLELFKWSAHFVSLISKHSVSLRLPSVAFPDVLAGKWEPICDAKMPGSILPMLCHISSSLTLFNTKFFTSKGSSKFYTLLFYLSVYYPIPTSKIHMLKPNHQCDVIRQGSLWEGPYSSALIKTPKRDYLPLQPCKDKRRSQEPSTLINDHTWYLMRFLNLCHPPGGIWSPWSVFC